MVKIVFPFRTKYKLLEAQYTKVNGVEKRTLTEQGEIFCSVRSFGGTEKVVDGIYSIEKTAVCQTWYDPKITSGSVLRDVNGSNWEIINEPENIDMANRYLQFKIRRVDGVK